MPQGTTQTDIFKKYAKEWGIAKTDASDPEKLLSDFFKKREKREMDKLKKLISEDSNISFSTRQKNEIKEKTTKIKKI